MLGFELSVVMFGFNEEENVAPVMEEALDYLRQRVDRYQLIFVDDGSTDRTRERAEAVAFLCSDKARWITGEIFNVDGGEAAMVS